MNALIESSTLVRDNTNLNTLLGEINKCLATKTVFIKLLKSKRTSVINLLNCMDMAHNKLFLFALLLQESLALRK